MKKLNIIFFLLLTNVVSYAQRFVFNEDSTIKAQTFINKADYLTSTQKDTLIFSGKNLQTLIISANPKLKIPQKNNLVLEDSAFTDMRSPNERVQLMNEPPVPIALEKVDKDTYIFIGYRRFKSPVTILHHVWLIKKIDNKLKILKKLVYFKNDSELICSYNKELQEIIIYPYYKNVNTRRIRNVLEIKGNKILTKNVIKQQMTQSEYTTFVSNEHLIIYSLPNGTKFQRRIKIQPFKKVIFIFKASF